MKLLQRRDGVAVRPHERGAALLLALFVLTALALIGMSMVASVAVNRRTGSDDVTKLKALRYAEAGVAEALNRIQNGEGPDPVAPEAVVQILLTTSPGSAGGDTTLIATGQPVGQYLPYSTATTGDNALTIALATNPARTQVYKYDKNQNPPLQFTTGQPVYRITSIGKVGAVSKRLIVDAIMPASGTPPVVLAALMANTVVEASGGSGVCGLNHSLAMPTGANHTLWHTGAGDVTGGWGTSTVITTGGGSFDGNPPTQAMQSGFPATPWDMLGVSQADFLAWTGPAHSSVPASPMVGPLYLDNDATPGNNSGSFSFTGGCQGSGFLYVDGTLDMLAGSEWRGLIYATGNTTNSASSFTLGAVMCNGTSLARTSGSGTVNYCSAAIQAITWPTGSKVKVIAWKEAP